MIKRFETFIGNDLRAWVASDTVKLNKRGKLVTMTTVITPPEEKPYELSTTFNLDLLPVYSIA